MRRTEWFAEETISVYTQIQQDGLGVWAVYCYVGGSLVAVRYTNSLEEAKKIASEF